MRLHYKEGKRILRKKGTKTRRKNESSNKETERKKKEMNKVM